jgi:hypothetical protein
VIGETSIGGVFMPTLLVLAIIAIILTALVSKLLSLLGVYRLIVYRPLVDLALFILLLGLLSLLTGHYGLN